MDRGPLDQRRFPAGCVVSARFTGSGELIGHFRVAGYDEQGAIVERLNYSPGESRDMACSRPGCDGRVWMPPAGQVGTRRGVPCSKCPARYSFVGSEAI